MASRETVEIGGLTYSISKFDAFSGLKILGDLQKQFLAPLLSVIDGKESGGTTPPGADPESEAEKERRGAAFTAQLMKGIEKVARDLDGDKLVAVAARLVSEEHILVDIDGQRRRLDAGARAMALADVSDLIELCLEVVRINFGPLVRRGAARFGAGRLAGLIQG